MNKRIAEQELGRIKAASKGSNSDVAYSLIRQQIYKRKLLPGDIVSENALARAFGMSRTPVREAVRRMVQESLLIALPKRGTIVATFSLSDIEETYNIREVLEGVAARLAAIRSTEKDISRIRETLENMPSCMARGDANGFFHLDNEFHARIAEAGQNRRLSNMLSNMRDVDFLDYFGRGMNERSERFDVSLSEHRDIVEAIAARDSTEAERRMREHCRSAARFIAERAFGMAGPSSPLENR